MDVSDAFWISGFIVAMFLVNLLHPLIFKYIDSKSLGSQSIFNLITRDHFQTARFTGNVYCIFAILSKLNESFDFLAENSWPTLICCTVYEFAFSTVCLNIGHTCFVRIFCLINMTFVEISVGETRLRTFVALTTLVVGIGVVSAEIYSGDISTGISFNLLTGNQTTTGKNTHLVLTSKYFLVGTY